MAKKTTKNITFEEALSELETLVETMEKGEFNLEDSLTNFERGVTLTRTCQQLLKDAETKVQILIDKNENETLAPFNSDND